MSHDEQIMELNRDIAQLQGAIDLETKNSRLKEKDPQVRRFQSQLNAKQERVEKRRGELRPAIVKHLMNEMLSDPGEKSSSDPDKLEIRRTRIKAELENLKENQNQVTAEVTTLSNESGNLEALVVEIKEKEKFVAELSNQLESYKLQLKLGSRVKPLDNATVPEGASQVLRVVLTIFAAIAGFVLGSGAVVGMEYQAHRLNSTGELGTRTGLRVLGTVPNLEALSRAKGLNGSAALQGILAESVDSIRTMLLQQSRDDAPHVIMVTSAGDQEGKTTVASHLAASLARSGRRTLLVDGDLRSPTVHAIFSGALEPGLCEILRGEADLEGAVQPTQVDGLMLIAACACDYQSIAALSKDAIKDLLQKAREQFDYVVFDAAPVLMYADTLLMGAHVDAAVLSVRRDVSQLPKVYEARERMESVGIRVLGAVVNGITETSRRPAYALPSSM